MSVAANIYAMFRDGFNTREISFRLQMKEADVSRILHHERCRVRGLTYQVERAPGLAMRKRRR